MTLAASPLAVATLSFVLAAGVTMVLVPVVRSLGLRFELIDQPDSRKQHSAPMVRLGGIAMVAGFGLSLLSLIHI